MNNTLSSSELMDLKRSLTKMVSYGTLQESAMVDILQKAGLSKTDKQGVWVDQSGSTYSNF